MSDEVLIAVVGVHGVDLDTLAVLNAASGVELEEVNLLRAVALDTVRVAHTKVVSPGDDAVLEGLQGNDLAEDDIVDVAARVAADPVRVVVPADGLDWANERAEDDGRHVCHGE